MDESVCTFIPPMDRTYFPGTMPLGLWAPTFDYRKVADAMASAIETLSEKKASAASYAFKTWDAVCANWLEDVRNEA